MVAALASACGGDDPAANLVARCGPVEFSSVNADFAEFPPLDADATAAMDELVNGETGIEAGGFDEAYTWSIASRGGDGLLLFGQSGGTDPSYAYARFDQRDGGWVPRGWGGCWPEIDAPGFGSATVATDAAQPPDPSSSTLHLHINEQACASGEAPRDRAVVSIVREEADAVTITVLVEPKPGFAECPSNPWYPITVELDEPLGDRVLLDGHRVPPQLLSDSSEQFPG